MSIKYIVLNGPPGSGKTTIAKELTRALPNSTQDSFAAPHKHFIATALGEKYAEMDKDKPRAELNGYSVREVLIDMSELYFKPKYGQDVFARLFVHRSLKHPDKKPDYVIVDDIGFQEELDAIPNSLLVRVFRTGKSFAQDSRSYLDPFGDKSWQLHNNGDVIDLYLKIKDLVDYIKGGK